ncbi:hypothetical protein ACWCPQ_17200 [Nocardia sp. NPDC001965]
MVDIKNAKIEGGPFGPDPENKYYLKVTYRAIFDPPERTDTFSEVVEIWESDDDEPFGGDDDQITAQFAPTTFVPGQEIVPRTFQIVVPRDMADTESGHERLYGRIYLRSSNNPGQPDLGPDPDTNPNDSSADRAAFTGRGDFDP